MKAIVREIYGARDVLHLEAVPLPAVGDGDVLVKVRAASANAGDWHLLRGTPLPFRLCAGIGRGIGRRHTRRSCAPTHFSKSIAHFFDGVVHVAAAFLLHRKMLFEGADVVVKVAEGVITLRV